MTTTPSAHPATTETGARRSGPGGRGETAGPTATLPSYLNGSVMAHGQTLEQRALDTQVAHRPVEYVTQPEWVGDSKTFGYVRPQPPYVEGKDRSLRGKARIRARKAANR